MSIVLQLHISAGFEGSSMSFRLYPCIGGRAFCMPFPEDSAIMALVMVLVMMPNLGFKS